MRARPDPAAALLERLDRVAPAWNAHHVAARQDTAAYVRQEFQWAGDARRLFGPTFDLHAKSVLDLGCGTGGGAFAHAASGARLVVGVDLRRDFLEIASSDGAGLAAGLGRQLSFAAADARRLAFPDASFDAVVATNAFEHIFGVRAALGECARVLGPRGRLFLSFPPYGSPWGAHLNDWLSVPWGHLPFGEAALVRAARRVDARDGRSGQMPPCFRTRLDGDRVPHLNRLTIRDFESALSQAPLAVERRAYLPIGWRARHPIARLAGRLNRHDPWREVLTSQAAYVLRPLPGYQAPPSASRQRWQRAIAATTTSTSASV